MRFASFCHKQTHACSHKHRHIHIYLQPSRNQPSADSLLPHTYPHIHIYTYTHTHIYICMDIHTYTGANCYPRTHARTHTQTRKQTDGVRQTNSVSIMARGFTHIFRISYEIFNLFTEYHNQPTTLSPRNDCSLIQRSEKN